MSGQHSAIGIDIGGTSVKIGLVHHDELREDAPEIPTTDFKGPDALLEAIGHSVHKLRSEHGDVAAVGVGAPGFVDFENGIIHGLTNVRGWRDYPLKERLGKALNLPVTVDNDANCMAYAEWRHGAGVGLRHLIAITLGTGVGGCVVANGEVVRGMAFGAGEVGQTTIDWQGVPGHYGNFGALEEYIGNRQIADFAVKAYLKHGINHSPEECKPNRLAKAAAAGDNIALACWDRIAAMLASALSNCCWLLNPEAIVIGGGVAKAGEILFTPLRKHLEARLSAPFVDKLQLLPARFGNKAGRIGAATMALDSLSA